MTTDGTKLDAAARFSETVRALLDELARLGPGIRVVAIDPLADKIAPVETDRLLELLGKAVMALPGGYRTANPSEGIRKLREDLAAMTEMRDALQRGADRAAMFEEVPPADWLAPTSAEKAYADELARWKVTPCGMTTSVERSASGYPHLFIRASRAREFVHRKCLEAALKAVQS